MDTDQFDHLTKRLSGRVSRRTALSGGSVGLAAAALGALASYVGAQDATPATGATQAAGVATAKTTYLFAQPFDSGTWAPHPSEPGTYLLTLKGDVGQTIYFSDRPQRIFGLAPTQKFLDGLGFSPTNPPNAALIAEAHSDEDQLVIELHDPVYDEANQTLTYHAKVLADYSGAGLAHAALQVEDADFADSFGHGSLFIDDCPDFSGTCSNINTGEPVANVWTIPQCWRVDLICLPCYPNFKSAFYGELCHQYYPDECSVTPCGDDPSQICDWGCYISSAWNSKNG